MYAFIKGKIHQLSPASVILETGGVGYEINISLHTFSAIQSKEETLLWTDLIVKEDGHSLYGFAGQAEKEMFRLLRSVSGIGPNTSRLILSGMTVEQARNAILTEDVHAFQSVKGVGPKTAKRVIIDLKDKLEKGDDIPVAAGSSTVVGTAKVEALSVLQALGFQKAQALKALQQVARGENQPESTEQWVKEALKLLSG